MSTKKKLRLKLRDNLDATMQLVNAALRGEELEKIEPVLARIGRGRQLPHWFTGLKQNGVLPNLDGKTIGSVIEMIFVAVVETSTLANMGLPPLRVNPARGVDLPDLDLGIKSPSENYCTSEPFFSAYERLLGAEHDILVLLTDYQDAKNRPPLKLKIIKWRYLTSTQIADESLCGIAKRHRKWLLKQGTAWTQKVFRFLAFVNQSDWRAKRLLRLIAHVRSDAEIQREVEEAIRDFDKQNNLRLKKDRILIPESDLEALKTIVTLRPLHFGVIDAADNWVIEVQKDVGRAPNENEWQRLLKGPLDGKIGMSFALQWRYNFGRLFGTSENSECDVE